MKSDSTVNCFLFLGKCFICSYALVILALDLIIKDFSVIALSKIILLLLYRIEL